MADPNKIMYSLDLSLPRFGDAAVEDDGASIEIRSITAADRDALAVIMLEGYRGTIDYEGEELEDAIEAVEDFLSDAPLLDMSAMAVVEGVPASAVLVMSLDDGPFIALVFSHPDHKRAGLAKRVVSTACRRLAEAGESSVRFAITEGNLASEALFSGLGAVPDRP